MRYMIKKEFYGAFCYDKDTDMCIALDSDSFELLKNISLTKDFSHCDNETYDFLLSEGFLTANNDINFYIIENEFHGETLSSPGRIHFYDTNKCNLNCKHCFSKNVDLNGKKELTYDQKIQMLDEMVKLGICEILVGGGEPFTDEHFCDFIEECIKRDIQTKVFTNGLLLTDEVTERISKWNLKYLSISIDGINDDEYFELRGVKGISILKENIRNLRAKAKYPVAISITVNSVNYSGYKEYLQLMKEIGVDRIKVRPTKPSGNVYRNPSIYLSPEQYLHFVKGIYEEWLKNYSNEFKLDCSWGDARLFYNNEDGVLDVVDYGFPYEGFGCFAGKASMVVDANGYVLPCGFLPKELQRTEEDVFPNKSLKEIWDTGKKFLALRKIKPNDECPSCRYYDVCRGGCIARILFEGKKINEVDPWCLKKYFPVKLEK